MERECLDEAERSRDLWGITASLTNLAVLRCGRGDYAAARSGLERAFEIHRRLGVALRPGAGDLGPRRVRRGPRPLGRGGDELPPRSSTSSATTAGAGSSSTRAGRSATCCASAGELERADEAPLRDAGGGARHRRVATSSPPSSSRLALLERDRERLDDAAAPPRPGPGELAELGTRPRGSAGPSRLGGARASGWARPERARARGRRGRRPRDGASATGTTSDGSGRSRRGSPTQAPLAGEAERLFEEGIRLLSDIGAVYELGRCYYEWGVRTDDQARAGARLGTAARLFERIGARRELDRAKGVLERIATKALSEAAASAGVGVIGLYEVSRIVNSTRDLSAVLDDTVDLALRRLNAERGMVLLTDPVTGRVSVRVARNLKTGREEEAEAISRSVVERVVADGRSVSSADARVDPRFVGRESILAHSIVSFLCVPLRVKERVSGAIYVDHRSAPRLFSESDRAFLEAFADLAAVAIENARLVEELLEARLRLSVENESLKANLGRGWNLDALVGTSEGARRIKATLPRAAAGSVTVLIRGESGTGKNLVARVLHSLSPRAQGPFIQFNCAALPETLAESELFGHEKGSFTGADRKKPGRFELAQGGTIFLDEIGKTTLAIQGKLLRVVEDKEFERVGGDADHQDRREDRLRHEPRPRGGDPEGGVPRGPLLPPQRRPLRAPAAAEEARGPPGPRRALRREALARPRCRPAAPRPRGPRPLRALPVARQHPRARGDAPPRARPDARRDAGREGLPLDPRVPLPRHRIRPRGPRAPLRGRARAGAGEPASRSSGGCRSWKGASSSGRSTSRGGRSARRRAASAWPATR